MSAIGQVVFSPPVQQYDPRLGTRAGGPRHASPGREEQLQLVLAARHRLRHRPAAAAPRPVAGRRRATPTTIVWQVSHGTRAPIPRSRSADRRRCSARVATICPRSPRVASPYRPRRRGPGQPRRPHRVRRGHLHPGRPTTWPRPTSPGSSRCRRRPPARPGLDGPARRGRHQADTEQALAGESASRRSASRAAAVVLLIAFGSLLATAAAARHRHRRRRQQA